MRAQQTVQEPSTIGGSSSDSTAVNSDENRGQRVFTAAFLDASFWRLYKWRIIAASAIVIFQTMLIVALLLERRRKRAAARLLIESEERYRNVVETQTELICRYLPDTTITFVNDAYCRYFSKSRGELIGLKFVDLIPQNARETALNHINSLIDTPRTQLHEHEVIRGDGSIGWQQWVDHVISREPIIELQGIGRDITARKRAEEALIASEEFNRRIVESTSDCVKVLDLEGKLIYMSERGQQLLEIKNIDQFINTSWVDLWSGVERIKAQESISKARTGEIGSFEGFANTISGSPRWWHTVITPMRGPHGKVERLLAVSRDITEQELADKAVRESEERFSKAFRANPQPMSITSLESGMFVDVNQSFLNMSGYTREEVLGHTSIELEVFETPEHRQELLIDPLLKTGVVSNFELNFRTKSGAIKVLLSAGELMELGGQKCILVASTDISERKLLEENLRLSEREFSTLVENSPDIISRLDRNLRIIYISPTLQRLMPGMSAEQFLGKTPRELALEGYDWQGFQTICNEAILTKRPTQRAFTFQNRHYWTRVIPEFADDGEVESLMSISEEVTDRIRSENELMQLTERLFNLQDEERRRIARELHDGTAQNLFAISVNLARLNQSSYDNDAQQLISECQSLGDQSLQEIRTLSYLLHPPLLDQAGLVSALQWYIEGFTKRSGIYVDLYAQPIGRLPSDIEMALFRVVQEALTNVRRHSASETAHIRLERKPDVVVLEIKDSGQGLSVAKNSPNSNGLISIGVGIPGMRQRLRQLGGRLDIASGIQGTTIFATVPLSNGVNHGKNTSR